MKLTLVAALSPMILALSGAGPVLAQAGGSAAGSASGQQFTMNGQAVPTEQVQAYKDHCAALLNAAQADGGGDAGVGGGGTPPVDPNATAKAGTNAGGSAMAPAVNSKPATSQASSSNAATPNMDGIDILDCVQGGFVDKNAAAAAGVEGVGDKNAAGTGNAMSAGAPGNTNTPH